MSPRFFKITGYIFFILLGLFSLIWYKERILYIDSANFLFSLINEKAPVFASERYGVVFTQLLPLLCIKLSLPLKWVMIAYSISFPILYFIVFLVCGKILNQWKIILPLMICLVAFTARSFFHPVTETHQALVYSLSFYAFLRYARESKCSALIFFVIAFLIIVLCFFVHQVSLFTLLFALSFDALLLTRSGGWKSFPVVNIILAGLVLILFLGKAYFTPPDVYEGQFYSQIILNLHKPFFSLGTLKFLTEYFFSIYIFSFFLFCIFLGAAFLQKRYLILLFTCLWILTYCIIAQLAFGMGDAAVMMEKNIMPLAFFISLPLMELLDEMRLKRQQIVIFICAVSLCVCFFRIRKTAKMYERRTELMERLEQYAFSHHSPRNIVLDKCLPPRVVEGRWCFSIETLLYSSLKGKERSSTFYLRNYDEDLSGKATEKNLFLGPYFMRDMNADILNAEYFDLKNTYYGEVPCNDLK